MSPGKEQASRQVLSGASFLRQQWARHTQPQVHLSETEEEEGEGGVGREKESPVSPGVSVWEENIELL